MRIFSFALLAGVFISASALAAEPLGTIQFHSFSLGTEVESVETRDSGFNLRQSQVSFLWKKDDRVSGYFALGTSDLRRPMFLFSNKASELSLTEVHVDLGFDIGVLRTGLIRLPFGYEGYLGEGKRYFPDSNAKKMNFHTSRDYGVQYEARTSPFFAVFSAHNGESRENLDPYLWYSGQWGIADEGGWKFFLSGVTGQTSALSTAEATSPIEFDPLVKSRLREGAITLAYERDQWQVVTEYLSGELIQNKVKVPYSISRVDLALPVIQQTHLLFRYEQLDPGKAKKDEITWSNIGFFVESKDQLVRFSLLAYKKSEKGIETKDDGGIASLRINSWF